jgi:tellurite resistance-related uncharacterized protein
MLMPTMPEGLSLARTTPAFTTESTPSGLRSAHEVADGVWGRLKVQAGSLRLVFEDAVDDAVIVTAGGSVDIPPQRRHHVEPADDAVFVVEFHR